ncbi:MAG TPA: hypothetical protein VK034_06235 [Enhygromyxa sp.]|nr:hypothetical protein [Enhygromyxa sp.]
MKPRRSRLRTVTAFALALGLTLVGAACDKGGDQTNKPGAGKNGGTVATEQPKDGGKDYVYAAEGFVLTATTKIKFDIASSQGSGAAELSARSLLEATPADGDKLKVHGKVLELIGYKGSGQLDPEFIKKQAQEQGGEAVDIVAELGKAESWLIIDRKGELDEAATKALAENQTDEDQSLDFGLFNLPDLPRIDLVEGEKITLPTKEVERQSLVGKIPVEIDESWTLRKIGPDRIAEIDVTSEGSGATVLSGGQGSANVSMLEESSYTILFNLDTKLPVSVSGYSQSELQLDIEGQSESITVSSNSEVEGRYEPGAASAPAAAPATAAEG